MRIAYLDCFSGISGDMFLGALIDAGVPIELFRKTVADLNVGATLEISRVDRSGISATKLDVLVNGQKDLPREEFWAEEHHSAHEHSHSHSRTDGEVHPHSYSHSHAHGRGFSAHESNRADTDEPHHHRSLSEILRIISGAPLSDTARRTASETFLALGAAEAKVHNVDVEHVHFHEVGAADAIVDIVCAAVGAEALKVEQFVASPLNVGGGTVSCAHGEMPVPAPATLELLREIPIYAAEIQKELVTPTGAAIVKVLVSSFTNRPTMMTEKIGYGAGTRNFPGRANVLRISVGETQNIDEKKGATQPLSAATEVIAVLETNLDDLNPQLIGYIVDLALAKGALEVFTTPVQMKKNRPGTLLTILAKPQDQKNLCELLFRESSTLGVRVRQEKRYVLARHHVNVVTRWGNVRIKVGSLDGVPSQYAPEFEDCRNIAVAHNVPLKIVIQEAIRLYLDQQNG
jgi:hypothetical protein